MRADLILEKERLRQQLSSYLTDLQDQKSEIQDDVQVYKSFFNKKYQKFTELMLRARTGALVMGGIYVVYELASWLIFGPDKSKETANPEQVVVVAAPELTIVQRIKNAIVSFLLSIAQRELMRLVNQLMDEMKKKEQESEA